MRRVPIALRLAGRRARPRASTGSFSGFEDPVALDGGPYSCRAQVSNNTYRNEKGETADGRARITINGWLDAPLEIIDARAATVTDTASFAVRGPYPGHGRGGEPRALVAGVRAGRAAVSAHEDARRPSARRPRTRAAASRWTPLAADLRALMDALGSQPVAECASELARALEPLAAAVGRWQADAGAAGQREGRPRGSIGA